MEDNIKPNQFKVKKKKISGGCAYRITGTNKSKGIQFQAIIDSETFEIEYPIHITHKSEAQIILESKDLRSYKMPKPYYKAKDVEYFQSHIYEIEKTVKACINGQRQSVKAIASQPVRIAPRPGDKYLLKDIYIEDGNVITVAKWSSLSTPMIPIIHPEYTEIYMKEGQVGLDCAVLTDYKLGKIQFSGKYGSILRYIEALECDDAYIIRKKYEMELEKQIGKSEYHMIKTVYGLDADDVPNERYKQLRREMDKLVAKEIAEELLNNDCEPSEEVKEFFADAPAIDEHFMPQHKWEHECFMEDLERHY